MRETLQIDQHDVRPTPSLAVAVAGFVGAIVLAIALQSDLSTVHFWWLDELFSLWASDPRQPFSTVFVERIAPDTNPPLYFSALYVMRHIIDDDRTAVVALNVLALIAAAIAVLMASAKAGRLPLGFVGVALFIISGPVLRYTLEARTYLFALAIVFVAAWLIALRVTAPLQDARAVDAGTIAPSNIMTWNLVGGLTALAIAAAFIHVYTALACGALAAGLLASGVVTGRDQNVRIGLMFGAAATVALLIWMLLFAPGSGAEHRIDWLEFSAGTILEAAWDPKILVAGSLWTVALIGVLSLYALVTPATRPLAITFAVAAALFIVVPILVSFAQPILHGRYWSIGAPMVIVFLLFAADRWWQSSHPNALAAAAATVVFFMTSTLAGYSGARTLHEQVWPWTGAGLVAAQAETCGRNSIAVHTVNVGPFKNFYWGFAKASGVPASKFRRARSDQRSTPTIDGCPVLGWAEHIWVAEKSDRALLDILGLNVSLARVDIRRHGSGYVVLRKSGS